jgi:23S rRNA (guanosine2251-2'-O)-methyltransferase
MQRTRGTKRDGNQVENRGSSRGQGGTGAGQSRRTGSRDGFKRNPSLHSRREDKETTFRDAPRRRTDVATKPPVEEQERPNFIAGRHPVLEALKAGRPINKILVSESSEGGSLIEILGKAKANGVVVQSVPKAKLVQIAGASNQGIIAYVAPTAYVELDDVITRNTGAAPLVLLLDEVSDPYNFGAILRTAEATGVQGVVIPKRRAVPLTETVAKAAAGAVEYVPVARVANLIQAIERLKREGYWIVGTDVAGQTPYAGINYEGPIAVVIGAEGKGLSRLVKEHCDYLVQLPMLGQLSSLNASVATGVILYEIVRQRG